MKKTIVYILTVIVLALVARCSGTVPEPPITEEVLALVIPGDLSYRAVDSIINLKPQSYYASSDSDGNWYTIKAG